MNGFLNTVKAFIEKNALLNKKDRVIVALSGGADSVCLLHVLVKLGYNSEAAHCNFHLRGEESMRDEGFVTDLCSALGIKLHKIDFDTTSYATEHKQSIEMAARELRYNWFEKLRTERDAQCIAVAHHKNDSAETLLLNLSRGTGIQGLRGISPVNGKIVRPLLSVHRTDIQEYLKSLEQKYVTDSTNLDDVYHRNFIRLRLIPELQQLNPSVVDSINTTAQHVNEAYLIYKEAIENYRQKLCSKEDGTVNIDTIGLMQSVSPRAVLFELLKETSVNDTQLDNILYCINNNNTGKEFTTPTHRIIIERNQIQVTTYSNLETLTLNDFKIEEVENMPSDIKKISRNEAYIDADKLNGNLNIRNWNEGDRFHPIGMDGSKLVSDYMTDRKFTKKQKESLSILCCGTDIIWLVNERLDDRFKVTSATKHIMHIKKM